MQCQSFKTCWITFPSLEGMYAQNQIQSEDQVNKERDKYHK